MKIDIFNKLANFPNYSPHATFTTAQLEETLRTMSANLILEAKLEIPMRAEKLDAGRILASNKWSKEIE